MICVISIIKTETVFGKVLHVYGTPENPLFIAKKVAEWIGHTNSRMMVEAIDEYEKVVRNVYTPGGNQDVVMLTEYGLYEVLMQSANSGHREPPSPDPIEHVFPE